MLKNLADHCRLVNPAPTDAYVQQRRSTIEALVADEDLSWETLESFVCFVAFGVPTQRDARVAAAAQMLVDAIAHSQPSFPTDIDANLLDLRLVAGMVVGERLVRDPTADQSVYLAAVLSSALRLHSLPDERYLAQLLEEVLVVANNSLRQAADVRRERRDWPTAKDLAVSGADIGTLTTSVNKALSELREGVISNARADREELDVLWWAFGGRSTRLDERLSELADGERVFTAAIELGDRMIAPPIASSSSLLGAVFPNDTPTPSLPEIVQKVKRPTFELMLKNAREVTSILESCPALLPLTWLSQRLVQSDLSPGWEVEFQRKALLSVDRRATLRQWSLQVLAERTVATLAREFSERDPS